MFVSAKAYAQAFSEADFDAHFMRQRRGLSAGLSEGKLAGILFFRLTRHRIISLDPSIGDTSEYENFQEKLVITIIASLLRVEFNDPWIKELKGKPRPSGMRLNFQDIYGELLFFTSRRHYNQESLALFFDTWSYLSHAVDTLRHHKLA